MGVLLIILIGVAVYVIFRNKKDDSIQSEEEIDLRNFRISVSTNYGYSLAKNNRSKNSNPGKWILADQKVNIDKFEINGGMIYLGGILKSLNGYDTDACLIDPSLKVDNFSPDYSGDHMGYWPSYCCISPKSRSAYLEWLANDRKESDTNIGYVFLFFYGLERRILVDYPKNLVSQKELESIVEELKRLKSIYGKNRSFNGYATSLLSHACVLSSFQSGQMLDNELMTAQQDFTSSFKFTLANMVKQGKALSPELALAWVKSHPDYRLRTPARRCEQQFDTLFSLRYKQSYGEGFGIKPNKTRLKLAYFPASASLRGCQELKLDLPDVTRLTAPFKKLSTIAEACTDELEAYSRFLGRSHKTPDSLEAISYLPKDLIPFVNSDVFSKLRNWIFFQISKKNGIVKVRELLEYIGEDFPIKINKKESEFLAKTLEHAGFGMAPDIRYHYAKPDLSGVCVLFEGGHGDDFRPTQMFNQAGTILRLGTMVAGIDNHIDHAEVAVLQNFIDRDSTLTAVEKKSLTAYMFWRLNTPINMTGLKSRIDLISNDEKSVVSRILITVALADGKIEPAEIKQIEKLYTSLGLDKSLVTSDIHNISSKRNVLSTSKQTMTKETEKSNVSLNHDLLRIHEEDTKNVKAVLDRIFIDENAEDISDPLTEENFDLSEESHNSLDEKHQTLYEKLVTKPEWSIDEVRAICEELNIMVEGGIELVNDWAFELVEVPVIENGSTVYVDMEVVEEIKSLSLGVTYGN